MGIQTPAPTPSHFLPGVSDTRAARRKHPALQPQRGDIQGTVGTGLTPRGPQASHWGRGINPTLTVAGLPVGQQPVASGADAAVAAQVVPALVLALVQHLALVKVCGARGVKPSGEALVPSGAHCPGAAWLSPPLPGTAKPRETLTPRTEVQTKWETEQQWAQELPFGHKVASKLLAKPLPILPPMHTHQCRCRSS